MLVRVLSAQRRVEEHLESMTEEKGNPMTRTLSARRIVRLSGLLAVAAAAVITPARAFAAAPQQATTTTNSVTLPLFGAPLTVDVTTDDLGALSNVTVNPADGLTATTLKPNRVVFETTGGTASIVVRNREGRQSVTMRAGTLADISGAGQWKGDVFGTNSLTTVDFTVAALEGGAPTITGVSSSDATAQIGDTMFSSDDDEQSARVTVLFSSAGQTRSLSIRVEVEQEDDGSTKATLKLVLGRPRNVPQPAADVAGPHSWDGHLCDGTPARIDFTIGLDGTVSGVSATPEPESIRSEDHTTVVRFSKYQRVRISAELENGMIALDVVESFRCGTNPTTNATIGERNSDDDDDDDRGGDRSSGVRDDDHSDDDDRSDDSDHSDDDDSNHDDDDDDDRGTSGPRGTTGPRGESGRRGGDDD